MDKSKGDYKMTSNEIKTFYDSLYIALPKDVADDVAKKFGQLLEQSFEDGAKAQREADVEACEESMVQWHYHTAEFLKNRELEKVEK